MDKTKIKTKEVWSANKWYLFFGILFVIMIILLEMCAIRQFFVTDNTEEALVLLFILQLPAMICLLFTTMIGDYIHREKFNIYYCKVENGIDIDYIKENYCIEDINESCVLFVDKGNDHNFCVWKLMQGYDSLYQAEIKMFL